MIENALERARDSFVFAATEWVAKDLWLRSQPIKGTLAEQYLRETVGLSGPLPDILGFCERAWCPTYGDFTPSLICPIYGLRAEGLIPVAAHQVFLCFETLDAWRGLDGEPVTDTLGSPQGGACWLGVPDTTLGIAASLEAALQASERFSIPVWAAEDVGDVAMPTGVTHVVLFGDPKRMGGAAAPYRKQGLTVTIQDRAAA